MSINVTKHFERRQRQRGGRRHDLEVLMEHASEVDGGVMLTEHNATDLQNEAQKTIAQATAAIKAARALIRDVERLKNRVVILEGGSAITIYTASNAEQHRRLRYSNKERRADRRRNCL